LSGSFSNVNKELFKRIYFIASHESVSTSEFLHIDLISYQTSPFGDFVSVQGLYAKAFVSSVAVWDEFDKSNTCKQNDTIWRWKNHRIFSTLAKGVSAFFILFQMHLQ